LRIDPERRETRELVQHEGLATILLGALELLRREESRGDLGRRLRERVHLDLPVALLRGAVLHVHDAERATVGPERSDHRFARGRVRATLHPTGQEHRPSGLCHRAGDAFADALAIHLRLI